MELYSNHFDQRKLVLARQDVEKQENVKKETGDVMNSRTTDFVTHDNALS